MKPIKLKKMKKGEYYLIYRNDENFFKEMEVIKFSRLEGANRMTLIFEPIANTGLGADYNAGIEFENGEPQDVVSVMQYGRMVTEDGTDRINIFDNMKIEFFELETSELIELICM